MVYVQDAEKTSCMAAKNNALDVVQICMSMSCVTEKKSITTRHTGNGKERLTRTEKRKAYVQGVAREKQTMVFQRVAYVEKKAGITGIPGKVSQAGGNGL